MTSLISGINNAIAQEKFWSKKKPTQEGFYWVIWRDGIRSIVAVRKESPHTIFVHYFIFGSGGYLSQWEIEQKIEWWSREPIALPDLPKEKKNDDNNRRNGQI